MKKIKKIVFIVILILVGILSTSCEDNTLEISQRNVPIEKLIVIDNVSNVEKTYYGQIDLIIYEFKNTENISKIEINSDDTNIIIENHEIIKYDNIGDIFIIIETNKYTYKLRRVMYL